MRHLFTPALAAGFLVASVAGPRTLAEGLQAPQAPAPAGAWGSVQGRVVLAGRQAPERQPLSVTGPDAKHCLGHGPLLSEEWVVHPKSLGVRWAFVWLAPEKGGPPLPIHPDRLAVRVDAVMAVTRCTYVPHALGLRQGQNLVFRNDDAITACPAWAGGALENPGGNVLLPPKQSYAVRGLQADKRPIHVTCQVRTWMSAWVRVFDHPYFAVTDEDGGFEIPLVPAGTWRLVVWHETGYGPPYPQKTGDPVGRAGTKIVVAAGETTRVGGLELRVPQAER
jgi:hypothetical protein